MLGLLFRCTNQKTNVAIRVMIRKLAAAPSTIVPVLDGRGVGVAEAEASRAVERVMVLLVLTVVFVIL